MVGTDAHEADPWPELLELAGAMGVSVAYWDQGGGHHQVPTSTLVAVLAAMELDASDAPACRRSLDQVALAPWRRMLPPIVVGREGATIPVWVHIPDGASVTVHIELEDGTIREVSQIERWVPPRQVDGVLVGEATFEVPADLPLGWHVLRARSGGPAPGPDDLVEAGHHDIRLGEAPLVVTPARLTLPESLTRHQSLGLMAQLYSVRSARSWGIGDLVDLADLAAFSACELGADWVLVNPLHAASPRPPMAPSPYLPVTRRFINPLYLRIEAIPEFAYLGKSARHTIKRLSKPIRAGNVTAELLDRDEVWAAKLEALELIHAVPLSVSRSAQFQAFCLREGLGLRDFATWCALVEELDDAPWPPALDDPRGPAVADAQERLTDRIAFFSWLQWLLDEQLAAVTRTASEVGLAGGIVHDLAVGVHPSGADAWALRHVLARGVSVGAPPDMYNQRGQDWSQPPWRPDALADAAFVPYRDMLRTILRHAGGIRVDHVLGLFRLWWVPSGAPPSAGTFVRYDHEALVGILALEAHRAGAFVIGEDLGTVERWVQDFLRDRGILGTSILWFERGPGGPLPPEEWRTHVLASVSVHDLPPTAGYLDGEHVRLRHDLGLLVRSFDEEWADHEREREEWVRLLVERGFLEAAHAGDPADPAGAGAMLEALHRFVAAAPSQLFGVSLPDLLGDRRAQNQPGTYLEYPNWQVPQCDDSGQAVLLEDYATHARVQALARVLRARR